MKETVILEKDEIIEIGNRLQKGEIGILPSDTIYSLSGRVTLDVSSELYAIKNREGSKKFIQLMNISDLDKSSLVVPSDIKKLWPAPFTAILNEKSGTETVAVRVPDDAFISSVLAISGPIYSTSVNMSGEKTLNTFDEIFNSFNHKVDFIVKAKIEEKGSSTLIDATKKPYQIIRQGSYEFK